MECYTIEGFDKSGNPYVRPKKQFDTLEEAVANADKVNADTRVSEKVIPYKCSQCKKYHIGRNGDLLPDKAKSNFKRKQLKLYGTEKKGF